MLFRLVVVPSVVLSMTNWVNLSHDAMHEMLEVIRCLWESARKERVRRRIYRECLVTEMGIVFTLLLTILKEYALILCESRSHP